MRCIAAHRSLTSTVLSIAALALALASPAAANANPPTPATATTVFQVPVTYVSYCTGVGFMCWVPYQVATVTPAATTSAPGVVTFSATPAAMINPTTADCIDVSIGWRNLTTGATGSTVLRAVTPGPESYRQPRKPDGWCHYLPATAGTGGGTVAATADVYASARPAQLDAWPQTPITVGVGVFQVP
ncbi:hypothetical protein [Rhodococcus sp. NPDC127528]|uniref:hypothetical protein n=1 Tax=unclassified Rhodococcus (in: high G+C Gram-positive bacteria) TaxID=192944 RepID=UPI0036322A90